MPLHPRDDFPRISRLSLVGALVLALPTLGMGFLIDDHLHLLILEGRWPLGSPFDLFRFAGGDPEAMRRMVQEGPYPWWTLPEVNISFWRPLSSALAVLDHRLFGRNAVGYHVHSIAWYLGLVALAGVLMRRFLPGALGALALLLFAVDDAHVQPTGWIANRNALVAATFALLGLWMHLEWREAGRRWALPLSLAGLALGLAAGETALGLFAYLFAYELLGARGRISERLLALAPAALLGLTWLGVYKALGYGAFGSSMYLDPVSEPARYLLVAAGRVPALFGGLVGIPVDIWALMPGSRPLLVVLGCAGLVLCVLLVRGAWPGLSEEERRHCRWLAAGAGLSLLPVASAIPMSRLLLVPSLGGAVLLAVVLLHVWRRWRSRERGWSRRGLALVGGGLALVHLVLAPLLWPASALMFRQLGASTERMLQQVDRELDPAHLSKQRVVILASNDLAASIYVPVHRALRGQALPRSWWTLSMSPEAHVLTRTGPASLELELPRGHFFTSELEQVLRGAGHGLGAGARVELEGMRVAVLAAGAEGPTRVGFEFDAPLEDPSLVFLHWREGELRRFVPPPVGARIELPALAASAAPPSPEA